jgi:hypothetical protein
LIAPSVAIVVQHAQQANVDAALIVTNAKSTSGYFRRRLELAGIPVEVVVWNGDEDVAPITSMIALLRERVRSNQEEISTLQAAATESGPRDRVSGGSLDGLA